MIGISVLHSFIHIIMSHYFMKNFLKNLPALIFFIIIIIIPISVLAVSDTNIVKPIGDFIYCYLEKIFRFLIWLAGLGTVAMIVAGGFFYTTSVGDPAKIKKATSTLTAAIVGLIITALSFAIMFFVGKNLDPNFSWSYKLECTYPNAIQIKSPQVAPVAAPATPGGHQLILDL